MCIPLRPFHAEVGVTLSITVRGEGRDLVLVHGWAMHGGIFAPLVAALEAHFRLHVVDLPGHGASRDYAPGDLDPARCARAIAAATPPAIWLGWSLGGLVALQAALAAPGHVQALVAVACSPRFVVADDWPHGVPAQVFADFARALEQRFDAAIERFLALETLGSAHAQEELRALRAEVFARGAPEPAALHEGLAILDRCDLRASLAWLRVPSLWIAGRRDRLVAPAAMHWAARQAANARALELPSGHAPFLGHAAAMAEAIRALAAETPA
jgi:pimeloyl-[acyl-carrier protein] methyl ester esterase